MHRLNRWILSDAGLHDSISLRYVIAESARQTALPILILSAVMYLALLVLASKAATPADGMLSDGVMMAVYGIVSVGQFFISAAAFAFTLRYIGSQRRRQAWNQLRVTAGGAAEAMRAAWAAAVYYRLSGTLAVMVYAPRFVLATLLFLDLRAFRGEYLTIIAGRHTPTLPALLELPLFTALVVAAFAMPITAIGLEAAVGLLFSTFARSPVKIGLIQTGLTAARIVWAALPMALFVDMLNKISSGTIPDALGGWLTLLANGAAGDWGLGMLHAAAAEKIWSAIPYAAYIGVGLLGVALLQSVLTALILRWAARRAQRLD